MASIDDIQMQLLHAATEFQQNFYEICSDWNRFEKEELSYVKDFIGYALFGPPIFEENRIALKSNLCNDHFVYDPHKQSAIDAIYNKVIQYASTEGSESAILCSVIYNIIFNTEETKKKLDKKTQHKDNAAVKISSYVQALVKIKKSGEPEEKKDKENVAECTKLVQKDEDTIKPEAQIYPVPVFKVRTYTKVQVENEKEKVPTEKIYYIDNGGRVYEDFLDYLKNNKLPESTMVLPKDGRYQMDPASCEKYDLTKFNLDEIVTKVWIEVHESPASRLKAKVLEGGDIATTVAAVASMSVGLAAMVTPVGAPITIGSALGAAVSGLWSMGRSVQQLKDRGQHGESISLTNKEALGAWIGIAGGTMGLASSGGTVLVTRAVRTGTTVTKAGMIAHDTFLIGNLLVNGVGIGFRSYDIVSTLKNNGEVSPKDVLFLTAHFFFFCNAIVNVQLAENFIKSSQGQMLQDYENSLRSNRHRKAFQRMARNTRAEWTNDVASNEEIIRGINKIVDKDEFFQAMVRNRKTFSASGAKVSFSNGNVMVNSVLTIDPIEFSTLPKDVRTEIVRSMSSVPVKPLPVKEVYTPNEVSYKNVITNSSTVLKEFCLRQSGGIPQSAPILINDFSNVLGDLRHVQNQADLFLKLLRMGYKILQAMPRDVEVTLGDTLSYIVQFIWDFLKSNIHQRRPFWKLDDPITQRLLNEMIVQMTPSISEKIEVWVTAFVKWLKNQFPQVINGAFLDRPHIMQY